MVFLVEVDYFNFYFIYSEVAEERWERLVGLNCLFCGLVVPRRKNCFLPLVRQHGRQDSPFLIRATRVMAQYFSLLNVLFQLLSVDQDVEFVVIFTSTSPHF